jgi:hypothetical protein
MHAVHLSGRVSICYRKIRWTDAGMPQPTFPLIVEEPTKGVSFDGCDGSIMGGKARGTLVWLAQVRPVARGRHVR